MIHVRGKDMLFIEAHGHVWEKLDGRRFDTMTNKALSWGQTKIGDEVIQFLPPEFADCSCQIEVLQRYEELLGFDKAVLLQTPCYGEQYEYINEIISKNPDKYVTVGIPNPQDKKSYLETAGLCLGEYGYKGLKFEAPDIPFDMTAPENSFVFEEILKYDRYFVIDMGWGKGVYDYPIDQMLEVARRYPELKIIIPHLGVSRLWDPEEHRDRNYNCLKKTLSILEYNENVWFDLSGIPMMVSGFDEYPYPSMQNVVRTVKEQGAIGRLMWGSDAPTVLRACTYEQHVTCFTRHSDFLTDEEMEDVLGRTADKVWFGKVGSC
ncbi:amidohydrolase family protein [Clostridium sp. AM58-1XD]|uniref:amidohydrolase family protein n=1 Tax=Clostridium sp. AM58-1XD TaxID=2292307 RepID=UPI000E48BB31|nr:amidohydrolase family protein [Clostridium sp. AM58-1XD]RGY98581.1 amidohydrolase [Clostridium sp. AM58-1XD]